MNRRGFLDFLRTGAAVVALDAVVGTKQLMAQESSQKLSDGDLEKSLNAQLTGLMEAAKTHPELQGFTIPPIKII